MKTLLSAHTAANGLVLFLSLFLVLHLLILTGVIPYTLVWGGRLQSHAEMVRAELLSLALNCCLLLAVANAAGLLRLWKAPRFSRAFFWLLCVLFLLNTLGNLLSESRLELLLFTPVTALLFLFSLRLALEKQPAIV